MPQVHNKRRAIDADPLMVVRIDFPDDIQRQIKALNAREERTVHMKLRYLTKQSEMQEKMYEKARKRIKEKLNKTIAYQLVLQEHNILDDKDSNKATNDHTIGELQHEVRTMMAWMQPESIKERKSRALIAENRKRYEAIVKRNKEICNDLFSSRNDSGTDTLYANAIHSKDRYKRISLPNIRNLGTEAAVRLRHSGGSIIQRKLSHDNNNAHTITMSMMKRQESFIEVKEKHKPVMEQQENDEMTSLKQKTSDIVTDTSVVEKNVTRNEADAVIDRRSINLNLTSGRHKKGRKQIKPKSGFHVGKLPKLLQQMNLREQLPAINVFAELH